MKLDGMSEDMRDQVLGQWAREDKAKLARNRTGPKPPAPTTMRWRMALPFPPTANTYYRAVGGRNIISKRGRDYRASVVAMVMLSGTPPMSGRLKVDIAVFWPDRRRRDLDNLLKGLLDALKHGGIYEDDSLVKDLHIYEAGYEKPGKVVVTVEVMT